AKHRAAAVGDLRRADIGGGRCQRVARSTHPSGLGGVMSSSMDVAAVALEPSGIVVAPPGFWRRVWKNKAVVIGCGLLAVIVFIALAAPWLAPYDPYAQDL